MAGIGGVMGTTVLGTILASRVGDVLVDRLTGAGLPAAAASPRSGRRPPSRPIGWAV